MARPIIYNNYPTAGSITWTDFGIVFDGVQQLIPGATSDQAYIWWVYNGGSPYLAAGNTYPTDLTYEDCVLFFNKDGIGMIALGATVINGGLIVPGSIYAEAIHADEIKSYHIISDAISSEHVQANTIMGEHVVANTITVDKLTAGSVGDSAVVNSSFEDFDANGVPLGWEAISSTNGTMAVVPWNASSGGKSLLMDADTTTADLRLRQTPQMFIPVSSASGRQWYLMCRAGGTVASTKGLYLRANWFNATKQFISSNDAVSNAAFTTSFAVFEGIVTPPSTARFMGVEIICIQPSAVTELYVDEVTAQEVIVSARIGSGQITTPKIAANAVVASTIAARSVGAQHMVIADLNNYWQNPDFEADTINAQPAGIVANTSVRVKDISTWLGPVSPAVLDGTTAGNGSGKALEIDAKNGSNNDVYDASMIPVTKDDSFYVYMEGRHLNSVGTGTCAMGFRTYTDKKVALGWVSVLSFGGTKTLFMTPKEGSYTVPDNVGFIQPWITFGNNAETTNKFIVDNIEIRKRAQGKLIVDGEITASKLETDLVLATKIIAGNPAGIRATMEPSGFKVYAADGSEAIKLGTTGNDFFGVLKADGTYAASITDTGDASFEKLAIRGDITYKGEDLFSKITNGPRGLVGWGAHYSNVTATSAQMGVFEISVRLLAGRLYKIQTSNIRLYSNTADMKSTLRVRYQTSTTGTPATPGVGSTLMAQSEIIWPKANDYQTNMISKIVNVGQDANFRLLLVYSADNAGATQMMGSADYPIEMWVEDIGPYMGNLQVTNAGQGTPNSPAATTYVKQYAATGIMSYYTSTQGQYMNNYMYQGASPAAGNLHSLATFQDVTGDLSGATINNVRVYFDFPHWYYNSGGTAHVGVHGHTSIPSTFAPPGAQVSSSGWPKPGARWVDLPIGIWNNFKTGATRGVSLQGDGTLGTYGYAHPPTLEITYTK